MSPQRAAALSGRLARLGIQDPARAIELLADPVLQPVFQATGAPEAVGGRVPLPDGPLLVALGNCADPDLALFGLLRLRTALVEHPSEVADFDRMLLAGGVLRDRLLAVLGASQGLADHLTRHPLHWRVLDQDADGQHRGELLTAVGADPDAAVPVTDRPDGVDRLRVAYRRRLLALAGRDLVADDPTGLVAAVAAELADLAAAALEAALALARGQVAGHEICRIAVLGMGKCGGRELNYVSDVDVIYVVEPVDGQPEDAALAIGNRLAAALARACSAATAEGTLWPVDANLRPEGRNGPLVRTLASHLAYYQRWAQTWEFQALLKARPVAGDHALGEQYVRAVESLVWDASRRENFVDDVQAMRRRVQQQVPPQQAQRELKLGSGGLRDVEFSVQLLQLVHGRVDPALRTANTWQGLEALSTYGYVGRKDAAELDRAYRFLRTVEHRIQVFRLHRTHLMPEAERDLRRIGRSLGLRTDPVRQLNDVWSAHARTVRRLHEQLFYRPLLATVARLSTDEARLSPDAAVQRLSALGFRDPSGALRHIEALARGVSRRAAIQRQLLPAMLDWFAGGADPDAGLLAFRRLSESLGSTHWYLKILRDSGSAAERLAGVLASSRLVAELLAAGPESVALLENDQALARRSLPELLDLHRRAVVRYENDPRGAAMAAWAIRRRETLRTAVADIVGLRDLPEVAGALSDAAAVALQGAYQAALASVAPRYGHQLPTRVAVLALGRLGGSEVGYSSDADVLFVHDPIPGADLVDATGAAMAVVTELRRLLALTGPEPVLLVDADLRPEGRQGALVRSLDSYAEYYGRWSVPWEAQALTRARPVAGDEQLAARFLDLINPIRWPLGGIDDSVVREIRRIKARVEAERLPRGTDPTQHLKLGRGGLSDVEWLVQLLQLQHAHAVPQLRTTSTMGALAAAGEAGLIEEQDKQVLAESWRFVSRARNAVVLWSGRPDDVLPQRHQDLRGGGPPDGVPPGEIAPLQEDLRRGMRRCRAAFDRLFWGD